MSALAQLALFDVEAVMGLIDRLALRREPCEQPEAELLRLLVKQGLTDPEAFHDAARVIDRWADQPAGWWRGVES